VTSALQQLLLPAECLLCHALLAERDAGRIVCPVCRHRWRPVRPPWCERCGQPEPHFGPCRLCAEWPAALALVRSAVWLADGAREAVHALKYGGLPRIAEDLADAMVGLFPAPGSPSQLPPLLVPIPLAPKRLRERGYNQSEALARALSRRCSIPMADVLVRSRETATQTALTPATRLANVAGAFATTNDECRTPNNEFRNSTFDIGYSTFVLVDDVFTTGATLAEAARALEQAGARTIHGITFGRAVIPDFT
jgi:competence protein ComFC